MTVQIERFRGRLSDEEFRDVEWLADRVMAASIAVLLWGFTLTIAVEHKNWSFWEILREVHRKFKFDRVIPK